MVSQQHHAANKDVELSPVDEEASLLVTEDGCSTAASQPGQSQRPRSSPFDNATFVERLTFSWLSPLLALGAAKQLSSEDLPELPAGDSAHELSSSFEASWAKTPPGDNRLLRCLVSAERDGLVRGALYKLAHDTVMFASPAALNALLQHLSVGAAALKATERGAVCDAIARIRSLLPHSLRRAYLR